MFIEHATGEFWIPMVDGAEDNEHSSAIDDVVEVAHHEVGVVHVDVKGNLSQRHTGDATEHEVHDEGAGK
jgi:hypothetical protein